MIKPTKAAPKNGDTIIIFPVNTIARILTPMEKPRTHSLSCIAVGRGFYVCNNNLLLNVEQNCQFEKRMEKMKISSTRERGK